MAFIPYLLLRDLIRDLLFFIKRMNICLPRMIFDLNCLQGKKSVSVLTYPVYLSQTTLLQKKAVIQTAFQQCLHFIATTELH